VLFKMRSIKTSTNTSTSTTVARTKRKSAKLPRKLPKRPRRKRRKRNDLARRLREERVSLVRMRVRVRALGRAGSGPAVPAAAEAGAAARVLVQTIARIAGECAVTVPRKMSQLLVRVMFWRRLTTRVETEIWDRGGAPIEGTRSVGAEVKEMVTR
jgi:hypothetical protein